MAISYEYDVNDDIILYASQDPDQLLLHQESSEFLSNWYILFIKLYNLNIDIINYAKQAYILVFQFFISSFFFFCFHSNM